MNKPNMELLRMWRADIRNLTREMHKEDSPVRKLQLAEELKQLKIEFSRRFNIAVDED